MNKFIAKSIQGTAYLPGEEQSKNETENTVKDEDSS